MEPILFALIGSAVGFTINWIADRLVTMNELPNQASPWRAPLVIIATAGAFAFLWTWYGWTPQLVLSAIYTAIFLIVLVTDLEHRLIFNIVMLPAILFAAIASPLSEIHWQRSLLGGVSAFVIVLGFYLFGALYARLRNIHIAGGAFGQGDITLATFMGIVTGFPTVLPAIIYTVFLGGVGVVLVLGRQYIQNRRVSLHAAMPYGPYFCIAGWIGMVLRF